VSAPDEVRLLFQVTLDPVRHHDTGRTKHFLGSHHMPRPFSLRIAALGSGFYLLYLDEHGKELTDTHHETVDDAFEQAEFEFGVTAEEWNALP
jgi:hypothetical protein